MVPQVAQRIEMNRRVMVAILGSGWVIDCGAGGADWIAMLPSLGAHGSHGLMEFNLGVAYEDRLAETGQAPSAGEVNRLLAWESDDAPSSLSDGSPTIPSETSEGRDFVALDTDQLSYVSHNSSGTLDPHYFSECWSDKKNVDEVSGLL